MAVNLSIKDVPDDMAEKLRQRAARNHRSLQGELMALVEQAVRSNPSAPESAPAVGATRSWTQGWKNIEQLVAEREAAGWQPDPSLARAPLGVDIVRADRDSR